MSALPDLLTTFQGMASETLILLLDDLRYRNATFALDRLENAGVVLPDDVRSTIMEFDTQ